MDIEKIIKKIKIENDLDLQSCSDFNKIKYEFLSVIKERDQLRQRIEAADSEVKSLKAEVRISIQKTIDEKIYSQGLRKKIEAADNELSVVKVKAEYYDKALEATNVAGYAMMPVHEVIESMDYEIKQLNIIVDKGAATNEILIAKIEAAEKQEPACTVTTYEKCSHDDEGYLISMYTSKRLSVDIDKLPIGDLYALPPMPVKQVPSGWHAESSEDGFIRLTKLNSSGCAEWTVGYSKDSDLYVEKAAHMLITDLLKSTPMPAAETKQKFISLDDEEIKEIRNRAKLNSNQQIDLIQFARDIECAVIVKALAQTVRSRYESWSI